MHTVLAIPSNQHNFCQYDRDERFDDAFYEYFVSTCDRAIEWIFCVASFSYME